MNTYEELLKARAVFVLSSIGWDYHDIAKVLDLGNTEIVRGIRKEYQRDNPEHIKNVRELLYKLENKLII